MNRISFKIRLVLMNLDALKYVVLVTGEEWILKHSDDVGTLTHDL
jgi:hypothetical protein